MSSWFGSGLSQITGQISNFTKEVLEEGTEEVDDVATQLRITRNKFVELDNYCQAQKSEIERLKAANDDLREKLEASELQVKTISNEYRVIIENKEKELNDLKLQQNELYDLHSKPLEVSPGSSPPGPGMPHSSSAPSLQSSYHGDEHDFSDVIMSQQEINRLRNENSKLEAEVRHWKMRCQSETSRVAGDDSDRIHELEKQIKELQQQYHDEIDQHQKELAALQDVHAQKLATLKHKNKEELAHLHEQLAELRDQVSDNAGCDLKVLQELRDRVQHLEKINQKLGVDLELTHAADREKARRLDELTKQLEAVSRERDQLKTKLEALEKEKEELMQQLDTVVSEQRNMSVQFSTKLKEQNLALKDAQNTSSRQSDLSDIQAGETSLQTELSVSDHELQEQVRALQKQVSDYEEEIKQFEMVKSDWQMEKEALEDVLLKLREQLRDREEKLNVLQAQKDLAACTAQSQSTDLDIDTQGLLEVEKQQSLASQETSSELTDQVELLRKKNSNLEMEHEELVRAVEIYKQELGGYKAKCEEYESLSQQFAQMKQHLSTKDTTISELRKCIDEKEKELETLSVRLDNNKASLAKKEIEMGSVEEKLKTKLEEDPLRDGQNTDEITKQIHHLQEEKNVLVLKIEEMTKQMEAMGKENVRLTEQVQAQSEHIKELKTEREEQHEKMSHLLDDTESLKKEVANLEKERVALNESLEELDDQHEVALAQIIEARDKLLKENGQLKARISSLEAKQMSAKDQLQDVQQLADEFVKLKEEQQKVSQKLNELQVAYDELSDIRVDLEEQKAELTAQLHQVTKERNELRQNCDTLHQQATSNSSQAEKLREQVTSLQEEIANLQHNTASLEEVLQSAKPSPGSCLVSSHASLEAEVAKLRETQKSEVSELSSRVGALEEQKKRLEQQLKEFQQKASEHDEQFRNYSRQLEESYQLDESSLQAKHKELLGMLQQKDSYISSLEKELCLVKAELTTSKEKFEDAVAEGRLLFNTVTEREKEITSLKNENQNLHKKEDEKTALIKKQQTELERLKVIETKYGKANEEMAQDKAEIEHLGKLIQENENKNQDSELGMLSQKNLDDDVSSLRQTIEVQQRRLTEQSEELQSLKDRLVKYEEHIAQLNQEKEQLTVRVEELLKSVEALKDQQHLTNSNQLNSLEKTDSTISNREKLKQCSNNSSVVNETNVIQNGDITSDQNHSSYTLEEMEKLKTLISQKDSLISQLNDNNSSLLKLLEERSQAMYGDQTLVDIHRLENEVRGLRSEKDQMMSILNEKTRECSSLKSEVHRLMNVISAEKTALSKLQQDNQELVKKKDEPKDDLRQEMKQEAIKKLSQIIRDKDMEIEALSQKNQTLLQVLQDSAQEGSQITALLNEKDNLLQQLSIFQKDREQIIAMLNAKHLESVKYHEEVQRLSQLLTAETQKHEQLQTEHAALKKQYEDKQHALVKIQNEMLNYKKKYAEIDKRFRELQQLHQKDQLVEGGEKSQSSASENPSEGGMQPQMTTAMAVELEDLRLVIKSNESAFAEKDKIIQSQDQSLKEKDQAIWERDMALNEKDKQLADLRAKVHKAEECVHSKDSELSNYKKQSDNLSFQLKGIQTECSDLRMERDQLYERNSVLQQELGSLKESNNKLTMSLHDKEFEISSLHEKMNALTKMSEKQGDGAEDKMQRVLKEMESQQKQAQVFKQERDQSMLALQQQQAENQQLRNEIQRLKEKLEKSMKELERLRSHLITIEENYTQEALAAEEREKELRNKLAAAEEKALASATAIQAANQQAMKQVESLQAQLHVMAEQRDDALLQLSNAQETANQYLTSLQNLQMVLEQFQMEKETQQNAEIEKYQRDIATYKKEIASLQDQIRQLQAQVDETSDALEAAQRLSEQLDRKEEMIAALREEVQLRESELMKMEAEIQKLSSNTESKVDKVLIKNLILGYFHTPASSRGEALRLIGRMLDFTKSEMEQIGMEGGRSWFGGLFKKTGPTPPTTPQPSLNKSFSELFVNFLERESSPQPSLSLPAERMVAESQQRHSHGSHQTAPSSSQSSRSQPAFNPFSAPVNPTLPLHISKDSEGREFAVPGHHPLIKPVSSSLPLLAAAAPESSSNLLMAPTGGPTLNSGAILRDVLQQ